MSYTYIQTCKHILINPADGRRYSSTAHEVANAKTPGKQKSAKKDEITQDTFITHTVILNEEIWKI